MKNPIRCFLLGGILLTGYVSNAQNFSLGARGGLSIPNLSAGGSAETPLNSGYSSRLGPDFGVFGEYRVSKLFSLEVMIEYSSQGGKKNGYQALTTPAEYYQQNPQLPPYLYATYKSEAKLNYLMVPILAKFGWNFGKTSPWRVYVDAGPFAGFNVSAKQVTSGNSNVYLDPEMQQQISPGPQSFDGNTDIKDQIHTFNFGIEGNVGLSYAFGKSNIFVEGGGNYGFLNIQKGSANGKNNTGAATAMIGYAYWFGKK